MCPSCRIPVFLGLLLTAGAVLCAFARNEVFFDETQVSGVVVPHHDVVKDTREAFFAEVSREIKHPETVVLISPNHFDAGHGDVQTTDIVWDTVFGPLQSNREVIQGLSERVVAMEPESFEGEHGITNVLADIKRFFPKVNIVPLILKRGTSREHLEDLNRLLVESCPKCLMVASVDFSHEQPALLADLHDTVSIRSLRNVDIEALLSKVEVDSPESLALLALWAEAHHTERFETFAHTNPGFMSRDEDEGTTTHVFGMYTEGDRMPADPSATFIISGDVMLGRGVKMRFENLAESFSAIGDRVFWGSDVSIVNLEGAITKVPFNPIQNEPSGYPILLFDPVSASVLARAGITMVSLANNHTNNAGEQGVADTHTELTANGVQWFGGQDVEDVNIVGTFGGEGISGTVIGVNTFAGVPDITNKIRELRSGGERVIVFAHWGDEYSKLHNAQQADMAYDWIDAGANLVVGSHPHVVQDVEVYRGRPIVYSLGNFLFDQQFSDETQQGMLLAGEFTHEGLMLFALPTESYNLKPRLSAGKEKQDRLKDFYEPWLAYRVDRPAGEAFFFPDL